MSFESFVGVRVAGGLLPAELLSRIGSGQMPGQKPSDYHLAGGETLREAANRAWAYLTGVWANYRQAAAKLPEKDLGTTLTRERWMQLLLRELGFGRVPTSRGVTWSRRGCRSRSRTCGSRCRSTCWGTRWIWIGAPRVWPARLPGRRSRWCRSS